MMPSTDRSAVKPMMTGAIACFSASIVWASMPRRVSRAATSSPSRVGRRRTSRAGNNIGRSDVELTSRSSGRRSTTTRLTYQSPSAVSDLVGTISAAGSNELSFRVGRSMTMDPRRTVTLSGPGRAARARGELKRDVGRPPPIHSRSKPPFVAPVTASHQHSNGDGQNASLPARHGIVSTDPLGRPNRLRASRRHRSGPVVLGNESNLAQVGTQRRGPADRIALGRTDE
jgi:hypothetical protein